MRSQIWGTAVEMVWFQSDAAEGREQFSGSRADRWEGTSSGPWPPGASQGLQQHCGPEAFVHSLVSSQVSEVKNSSLPHLLLTLVSGTLLLVQSSPHVVGYTVKGRQCLLVLTKFRASSAMENIDHVC